MFLPRSQSYNIPNASSITSKQKKKKMKDTSHRQNDVFRLKIINRPPSCFRFYFLAKCVLRSNRLYSIYHTALCGDSARGQYFPDPSGESRRVGTEPAYPVRCVRRGHCFLSSRPRMCARMCRTEAIKLVIGAMRHQPQCAALA